ncbi:hypothetical protein ABTZ93_39415 [Streptomyces sp. NPDC097941]|uniref:Glycerol kinase n=1 Tax=Streptomyces turgidiscabies TaxID=85558 RepID=A0ABU0RTV9_9ACTN|nr:hypothetical protein [Streptomyces turgidiscabies]MDQ0935223.1 glycerol kinase [Streptomyces turgidiscabies]
MTEQERIETRVLAVLAVVALMPGDAGSRSGALHLMLAADTTAHAQAELMRLTADRFGIAVARLSSHDSDSVRATAYQAEVVVGTVDDFVVDLGREKALGITRNAVMIEGGPGVVESELLSMYRSAGAA